MADMAKQIVKANGYSDGNSFFIGTCEFEFVGWSRVRKNMSATTASGELQG